MTEAGARLIAAAREAAAIARGVSDEEKPWQSRYEWMQQFNKEHGEALKEAGFWIAPWDLSPEQLADLRRHRSEDRWWPVLRDLWLKPLGLAK